jgi:hypothetical protein
MIVGGSHTVFLVLLNSDVFWDETLWVVPDIQKEYSTFIFRVKKSSMLVELLESENEDTTVFQNVGRY